MKKRNRIVWIPICIGIFAAALGGCAGNTAERQALRLQGIEKIDAGDYSGAISDLDQALSFGKGSVGEMELDILKYRAEAEYLAGDYSAAAHTYDILIQVDEEGPEYVRLRCISNIRGGDVDTALEDFSKLYNAVKNGTDGETAEIGTLVADVGKALEDAGRAEEAMEIYRQAETDGLADSAVYNSIGVQQLEEGNYSSALEYFEKGLASPDGKAESDLMFNRAVALEYQGNYQEALAAFEEYTAKFGEDQQAEHEIEFLKTR